MKQGCSSADGPEQALKEWCVSFVNLFSNGRRSQLTVVSPYSMSSENRDAKQAVSTKYVWCLRCTRIA